MPTNLTTTALEMAESQHHYKGYVCLSDEDYAAVILRERAKALEEELQRIELAQPSYRSAALFMLCWSRPLEEKIAAYLKAAKELEEDNKPTNA